MAGEKRAKAYEIITALSLYLGKNPHPLVRREVTLPGVSIRSDVVIGTDENPKYAVLVTHSTSEVDYHKKFARDSAELIQLFTAFPDLKGVVYVTYDNLTLPGLKLIIKSTFSSAVSAGDFGEWPKIQSICENILKHDVGGRIGLDGQITDASIELLTLGSLADKDLLTRFGVFLWRGISAGASDSPFATMVSKFIKSRSDSEILEQIKHTRVRRGLGKLLLFTQEERELIYASKPLMGDYSWAKSIGLVSQSLSTGEKKRWRVADPEIISGTKNEYFLEGVLSVLSQNEIELCLTKSREKAALYVKRLRVSAYLDSARDFVCKFREQLATEQGMESALRKVSANPRGSDLGIEIPNGVSWNWLYTYLVALYKAADGKKQGFGTTVIARLSGERRFRMQNSILSSLEYRLSEFPEGLFAPLAKGLCIPLRDLSDEKIKGLHADVLDQQLTNELEDKLLCHGLDHPLQVLIENSLSEAQIDYEIQRKRIAQAEAAGITGNAGLTSVIIAGNTLIWWRAAHWRNNVNHKTKELECKVAGWRICWDEANSVYKRFTSIKKAFLVLDGDFLEEDLIRLKRAGWDNFYYADQMADMVNNVV
jgi:hypothetical protein